MIKTTSICYIIQRFRSNIKKKKIKKNTIENYLYFYTEKI
jgi:hypothetical protein